MSSLGKVESVSCDDGHLDDHELCEHLERRKLGSMVRPFCPSTSISVRLRKVCGETVLTIGHSKIGPCRTGLKHWGVGA